MRLVLVIMFAGCSFSKDLTEVTGDGPIAPDGSMCVGRSMECASPDILRACSNAGATYVDRVCTWGCVPDGEAHCGELAPAANAVTRVDLTSDATLADLELPAGIVVDGTTGTIGTSGAPTSIRAAGIGNKSDIIFELRGPAGMFKVRRLEIAGTILLTGTKAIVIVSDQTILVEGEIDARGNCTNLGKTEGGEAGPGGLLGGKQQISAVGSGAGTGGGGTNTNGAGGGGHGGVGGKGAGLLMAAGGPVFDPTITMLVGGGGGGGGGGQTQPGGGGGGALQLISNTKIEITATGGINAGGCGGFSTTGPDSGGGGGAGGTILLEAPAVKIVGKLAVNGGGGGAGENPATPQGENGRLDRTRAAGAIGLGIGGAGGAGAALDGAIGITATKGGGGGGAVGRIHINTRADMALTLDVDAVLSPAFEDAGSACTRGAAVIQ